MNATQQLVGRVLLASIFLMAGISKLGTGYAGTQAYMDSMGVPGALLPLVILLEIGAAIALLAGYLTRASAWALAVFTLAAAIIFHGDLSDHMQSILFMKNLAIVGGLMLLASAGPGSFSVEKWIQSRG